MQIPVRPDAEETHRCVCGLGLLYRIILMLITGRVLPEGGCHCKPVLLGHLGYPFVKLLQHNVERWRAVNLVLFDASKPFAELGKQAVKRRLAVPGKSQLTTSLPFVKMVPKFAI